MRITSVKLKEFGRHAMLDLDMNAGVVGVVGVNGCGKSTFLKAIEFAFTGLLADAAETYVRNIGTSEAASNASVELTFVKHGIEGRIFRQIGKTTKRLLSWNGTEYKSAADVENCIREIIGADKQALSNAVFISQGELDRLLFGGQVEREQLFIKLLLLSHLEKVGDTVVKDQIKALIGGTTNFDAVLEEIAAQEADATATALSLGETLKTSPDHSQALQAASELLDGQKTLSNLQNQLSDMMRNKRDAETKLQSALGAAGFADLSAVEQEIDKQSALAAVLDQKMQGAVSRFELEARARIAKDSLSSLEAQLKSALAIREEALRKILPEETRKKLAEFVEHRDLCVRLNDESEKLSAELQPLLAQEGQLRKWILDEQSETAQKALDDRRRLLKEKDEIIANLRLKISVLEPTLKTAPSSEGYCECPICDRPLNPGTLTAEKLDELKSDLANHITDRNTLDHYLREKETKFRSVSQQLAVTGAQSKQISDRLTDVVQKAEAAEARVLDCGTYEEAVAQLSDHDKSAVQLSVYTEERLVSLESQISAATEQVRSLDKELAETPELTKDAQAELKVRISNTQNLLSKATQLRKVVLSFEATIEASATSIQKLNEGIVTVTDARDRQRKAMFEVISHVEKYEDTVESIQAIVDGLAAMQQKRAVLEGQVKQATGALAAIIERKKDIESRVAKEQFKKELVKQLEILSNTFNRKGLPLKYVNYRFGQLVELTAANLSTLGANFTVVPDEEKSVSFKFKRLDDAEEFYMGQEKLSGGQRVRLTVAFLLAVQQLVIPDVGLLILDEPSVHLDQEGTESLAEMLASMGEQLHDGEAQVIVCDHNTALEPAFQKLVRLGS